MAFSGDAPYRIPSLLQNTGIIFEYEASIEEEDFKIFRGTYCAERQDECGRGEELQTKTMNINMKTNVNHSLTGVR